MGKTLKAITKTLAENKDQAALDKLYHRLEDRRYMLGAVINRRQFRVTKINNTATVEGLLSFIEDTCTANNLALPARSKPNQTPNSTCSLL